MNTTPDALDALEVIAQARAAGLDLIPNGDRLRLRAPSQEALDAWRETLRAHKPAILAALADEAQRDEAEVAWRVAAFRAQIPPRGPIPFLIARASARTDDAPRCCGHCGDALAAGRRFCCAACQRAKERALLEIREGVTLPTTEESREVA